MKSIRSIRPWIPFLATVLLTAVTLTIYTKTVPERQALLYIQAILVSCAPAVLPALSLITKRDLPIWIHILIAVHAFLAGDLGTVLNFYSRIPCWDLLLHGYFGFFASCLFYEVLLRWNGMQLNRFGFYFLIFLAVMGCAAIWEIFEYSADSLIGTDAQQVQVSLQNGISPMEDTMTDIIIAIPGILAFYLVRFFKTRFIRRHTMN